MVRSFFVPFHQLSEFDATFYILPDQVERVSHAPSTVVSASEMELGGDASEMDDGASITGLKDEDGDVDMKDNSEEVKTKVKRRKVKRTIPIGKNGLKKRRVTKSRKVKDSKGYIGML